MKTVKGLSFGFSTVNAGQRATSVEPQVIAVSTEGNFRVTAPVTKALGIAHGDYVMFLSNVDNIDAAIAAKAPELVEFCNEAGLELGTPEALIAIHKEFDMWAIAKGIAEFDSKGNARTTTERWSKKDKLNMVAQHFDEALAAALEQADDETKDALTREGVTREEQMDILAAAVKAPEVPKFKGSKCANPAQLSGAGVNLNFTDSNVWKQLKVDMGEAATSMNRVYSIDLESVQDIVVSNGYEDVTVKAFVLGDSVDKEPARIGTKTEE